MNISEMENALNNTITVEEEWNNFSNIISSIDCLTESGIISINEKLDFSNLKEKAKKAIDKVISWFKTNVIDRLKDLWKKIKSATIDKLIKSIKNSSKLRPVEFNSKEDYADEYGFSESTILLTESSKRELQLKIAVSKLICPELFFKADNYINFTAYKSYFNDITKYLETYHQAIADANPKNTDNLMDTALDDNVMKAHSEFADNIIKNGSMFIGPLSKVINMAEVSKIKNIIDKDLEKRCPKSISATSLISLVEENTKDADKFINEIKTSIANMNTLSSQATSLINNNSKMNKFTLRIMTDIATTYKSNAQMLAELLTYVTSNYSKSAQILSYLKMLDEIL